jgi:hypothetical protein
LSRQEFRAKSPEPPDLPSAAAICQRLAMDDDPPIPVSPRHSVLLARDYLPLLEAPPKRDFVLRTLAKREAGNMLLMLGELVIAGVETRAAHPLAATYPLHFRKTYFPGRLHGDPKLEYDSHARASQLIDLPPPIGYSAQDFRSCLIPGKPYSRLSPFGAEPEQSNVDIARRLSLAEAAGLWRLAEDAFCALSALHAGGLAHGDAELHNLIVCPSPLELVLIDFEAAVDKATLDENAWQARCAADLVPLLREAAFLQCALGRQVGALAECCWQRMGALFREPERFQRAIERGTSENT